MASKQRTVNQRIPLGLYVHLPWCVRKCPYCDFNSHAPTAQPPFSAYVDALLADLDGDLRDFADGLAGRTIETVFFGGGTPSLFPADQIARILTGVRDRLPLATGAEISLEANPGTIEHGRFSEFRNAGINRISIGAQSFDDARLADLGRIHRSDETREAFAEARAAGFSNINIDLMFALPGQNLDGALADVESALALQPEHISFYQLTLEPGTPFARSPPSSLPDCDSAWVMQEACLSRLSQSGYIHYEVSAHALQGRQARHNLAYWTFADYLGIGAGAHSKLTLANTHIERRAKRRNPSLYLASAQSAARVESHRQVAPVDIPFEFMLNALRLNHGVPATLFTERTGLPLSSIERPLAQARAAGLMRGANSGLLQVTPLGARYLNDLLLHFMT